VVFGLEMQILLLVVQIRLSELVVVEVVEEDLTEAMVEQEGLGGISKELLQ
jgi:hypothetical protein